MNFETKQIFNMNNFFIDKFKHLIPSFIRKLIRRKHNLLDYNIHERKKNNPYLNDSSRVVFNDDSIKVGIIKEFYQYHKSYLAACHDLKINYVLIDISKNNWISQIKESGCDVFLFWPSSGMTEWKIMYDDRIRLLVEDLNKKVYPEPKALWLYENKMRTAEWLKINNFNAPEHWVFYNKNEALKFADDCILPIVYKTNIGASASGVKIIRKRRDLKIIIKTCFIKGIAPDRYHPMDRDLGKVFLQQYIEQAEEWRMVRIDDSYFGYRKDKVGEFHSGSKSWSWLDPGEELLNLTKKLTDFGKFSSMNVDVFKDKEGQLFVNELQALFGASSPKEFLKINDIEGRYIFIENKWRFEPGNFYYNQYSNLRLLKVINDLKKVR